MNDTIGYEWSDSGRKLLLIFNELIALYGGNDRLAYDIECELCKSHHLFNKQPISNKRNSWANYEVEIVKSNIHLGAKYIQTVLKKRTLYAVKTQIYFMRKDGLIV